MNMKRIILSSVLVLFLVSVFTAQTQKQSVSESCNSVPATKRLQFWVLGSIEVPLDYSAKIIATRTDAPYGYISSNDGKVKIAFSYGLVERAINERNKKDFTWIKTLLVDGRPFVYGLSKKGKKMEIVACNLVNFYQEIEKEEEIELFLDTIKTFKSGKCDECEKPSRWNF